MKKDNGDEDSPNQILGLKAVYKDSELKINSKIDCFFKYLFEVVKHFSCP